MYAWPLLLSAAVLVAVRTLAVIVIDVSRRRTHEVILRGIQPGMIWVEWRSDGSMYYYGESSGAAELSMRMTLNTCQCSRRTNDRGKQSVSDQSGATALP